MPHERHEKKSDRFAGHKEGTFLPKRYGVKKLTKKQIKYFGTKRQRAALKRSTVKSSKVKTKAKKTTAKKTTKKKKAATTTGGFDLTALLTGLGGAAAGYTARSLQDFLASKGLPSGPTLGPTPTPTSPGAIVQNVLGNIAIPGVAQAAVADGVSLAVSLPTVDLGSFAGPANFWTTEPSAGAPSGGIIGNINQQQIYIDPLAGIYHL